MNETVGNEVHNAPLRPDFNLRIGWRIGVNIVTGFHAESSRQGRSGCSRQTPHQVGM